MAVAVIAVAIIITVAVVKAAGVMARGKGSGKNPEKSSLWREGGFLSGLPIQKGTQMGVISVPIDASPA